MDRPRHHTGCAIRNAARAQGGLRRRHHFGMPFGMLCNTEMAAHRDVTLAEWVFEWNLLNIFVAIFIPVPLPFPPRGAVVASFGLSGAVVCMVQAPEDESVRYRNQTKT
jgi:hypothetical protein